MTVTFDDLDLHPQILKAIAEAGYSIPTEIQLKSIPKIASGVDVRAAAQTGTGKTAAFLLPALHRLAENPAKGGQGPRVLVLAPTRELAMQIANQAKQYSKYLNRAKTVCIGGGVPYQEQMRQLSRPYELLIATPGRLQDLVDKGKIQFSRLEMLVLDEADRMLDMGFIDAVEKIVSLTPKSRQTLLFSATLQGSVLRLSEKLLNSPVDVIVSTVKTKNDNIQQSLFYVDDVHHKNRLLDHILREEDAMDCTIIFTSTKRYADQLVDDLSDKGHDAAALHGDMSQRQRTRTMMQLRNGKIKILVATDVAARGIDLQSITHVINFDLPRNVEDYVHRIGRTGRAGAKGVAFSFAERRDTLVVKRIEEYTGHNMNVAEIEGLEPRKTRSSQAVRPPRSRFDLTKRFRPQKRETGRFGRRQGGGRSFRDKD